MRRRRPRILIATSYGRNERFLMDEATLPADYVTSVVRAGGTPVPVPPMEDGPAWRELVALGDGVLIVGGLDLDPARYGQAAHPKTVQTPTLRQEADARLLRWAERRQRPVLAVCLGIQSLNVYRGGTLVQDISDQVAGVIGHQREPGEPRPRHPVRIDPASRLAKIVGATELSVNTSHHQAIAELGRHLEAVAWSADGIVEAAEDDRPDRFILAVQWHPEELWREKGHLALFKSLVSASRRP